VIPPGHREACHGGPGAGCRIPHFGRICWIGRSIIWTLCSPATASHQDLSIRKQGCVMKFSSSRHWIGVSPGRATTGQIDDLRRCRWRRRAISRVRSAGRPSDEQHFAGIVHYRRSPIADAIVAIAHQTPGTGTRWIKITAGLTRPCTKYLPIGCYEHEWVEWQGQVCRGEITPRTGRSLPDLRLDINPYLRVNPTTGN
jgi:hypothetical protein